MKRRQMTEEQTAQLRAKREALRTEIEEKCAVLRQALAAVEARVGRCLEGQEIEGVQTTADLQVQTALVRRVQVEFDEALAHINIAVDDADELINDVYNFRQQLKEARYAGRR